MKLRLLLIALLACGTPGLVADQRPGREKPGAQAPETKDHYALLVGVTHYQNFPSLDLEGPANDVILMHQLLTERYGFPAANIVTLSEAVGEKDPQRRPTRANLQREMHALAKKVEGKTGARVVVHMSGHGSRQPDLLRDDPKHDGMSELFLPADLGGWDEKTKRVENAVIDFELRDWLAAIQATGASVWAIVDSCNSGTIARGLAVPRNVDPAKTLRIPRAAFEEAAQRAVKVKGEERPATLLPPIAKPGLVAIYAALPTEPTFEDMLPFDAQDVKEQKKHGLLTWFLCEVLNDVTNRGKDKTQKETVDITYTELVQRIQRRYRNNGLTYPTPLVEGRDRDQGVGGGGLRRTTIFLVKEKNGSLTINAGRLHGLMEHAVLAVFPPAGQGPADKLLGHVRVAKAGPVRATVEPWNEKDALDEQKGRFFPPKEIPNDGGRCEPAFVTLGEFRLTVGVAETIVSDDADPNAKPEAVDPAVRKHLREQLEKSVLFKDVKQFVQLTNLENARWLLQGLPDGQVRLIRREGMKAGAVTLTDKNRPAAELAEVLRRIARAEMLMRLAIQMEPDAESIQGGTALVFDTELRRQKRSAGEPETIPLTSGAGPVLHVGDRVWLRFLNRGKRAADITVFQIDQNYDIIPMFPQEAELVSNRLLPPELIKRADKYLQTARPTVNEEGLAPGRQGNRMGVHHFVVLAVKSEGALVDFRVLARPTGGERNIERGLPTDTRSLLKALQGQADPRAGFGFGTQNDFAGCVFRFEIHEGAGKK